MSAEIPGMSAYDHANTSLFILRNVVSSSRSSSERCASIRRVLSGCSSESWMVVSEISGSGDSRDERLSRGSSGASPGLGGLATERISDLALPRVRMVV